jgi:hypothetical protein
MGKKSAGEVQIWVTRAGADESIMAVHFFPSWCVHESILQRGSEAA